MKLNEIQEAFENLESEINGAEPTVQRCRDWAAMLANLCGHLAYKVAQIDAHQNREIEAGR